MFGLSLQAVVGVLVVIVGGLCCLVLALLRSVLELEREVESRRVKNNSSAAEAALRADLTRDREPQGFTR